MRALAILTIVVWLVSLGFGLNAFRTSGLLRKLRRLLGCALFAGVGLLFWALLFVSHAFSAFSRETLVATVVTWRLSPEEFELIYTTPAPGVPAGAMDKQPARASRRVRLRGDQWSVSGGIVKWHPWLTALGFSSYHRVLRLSGQFSDLEQQRARPPTVFAVEPVVDRFWEALYWMDPYLPFIEAVYGSSAYAYVEPNTIQEVYVTPSGYLIKRSRGRELRGDEGR